MTSPITTSAAVPEHGVLTLPDGRRLGYSQAGVRDGPAVLYLHGNPGSRTEVLRPAYLAAFAAAGLHLVAVDRPGYGDSDPPRALGHAVFAHDVRALLAALLLDAVVVIGASRGALPSLALAAVLPQQVRAVGLFGPTGLPDDPDLLRPLSATARGLLNLVKHRPKAARAVLRFGAWLDRRFPRGAVKRLMQVVPSRTDRAQLREPGVGQEWVDAFATGMRRDPAFAVTDWRSWLVDALGFELAAVTAPVLVWTGADDRTCPPPQSAHLASRLPDARRTVLQGVGHLHTPATLVALMRDTLAAVGTST